MQKKGCFILQQYIKDKLKLFYDNPVINWHEHVWTTDMWNNADPAKTDIDLEWVENNAVILHYYGRNKPWKDNYKGILGVFYTEQKNRICAIG